VGIDGNTVLVTGQIGHTASFGSVNATAVDSADIFVAAYDNTGNFLWVKSVGGTPDSVDLAGFESGIAVCGNSGVVYATGALLDNGTFGTTNLSGYHHTDVFLTKLSTAAGLNENKLSEPGVMIYPNPATEKLRITHQGAKADVCLLNNIGEVVYKGKIAPGENVIDVTTYDKGIYLLQINSNEKIISKKVVIE
jgi:hypothetical protein